MSRRKRPDHADRTGWTVIGRAGPCLFVAFGAGCALLHPTPDRSRYFTLAATGDPKAVDARQERELAIGLGPITLPDYLDRPEVVFLMGTNELHPWAFDVWAVPLAAQFKGTLARDLAVLIDGCEVTTYPWYPRTFDATVRIDVLRFDVDGNRAAHLVVRWDVRDGDGSRDGPVRESSFSAPVAGNDASDAVAALSAVLGDFSREIVSAVLAVPARRPEVASAASPQRSSRIP